VGRDPEIDPVEDEEEPQQLAVTLKSNFISKTQLRISQVHQGWVVQHVGANASLLNDEVLDANTQYKLNENDEIRVGEYTLTLIAPKQAEETEDEESVEQLLTELEKNVHSKLLENMNLRRGSGSIDLKNKDIRARILSQLDTLTSRAFDGLTNAQVNGLVRLAFYRALNKKAMSAGSNARDDGAAYFDELDNQPYLNQFNNVLGKILADLDLSLDNKSLEEDNQRISENFTACFNKYELDLSPGVIRSAGIDFVKRNILDLIFGLGPIQDLMEMDCISEVMVVSRDKIFIEKFGVVEDSKRAFFSDGILLSVIDRIVAPVGRRIDRSSPMVDAHLHDGSRVNAVIPPLALKGPCLTIRKFSKTPLSMADLIGFGAVTPAVADFLRACVQGHKNVVVSGGTGSGKTTMLNCISAFIPRKERIVTIEDTAELQLQQEHVVTLESRPPNIDGKGEITIRDLVKNALRMRPDRVVIGECRGGEALDMLQAMNTGHDGSMTTGHANSPADMMRRLETMVLMGSDMPIAAIREQIASAVDLVVQLNRLPDGRRVVTAVSEISEIDDETGQILTEDVFRYYQTDDEAPGKGQVRHTGYIPSFTPDLLRQGLMQMDTYFKVETG